MKNNEYIWDIHTGYASKSGQYRYQTQFKFIKRNFDTCLPEGSRILDVGGGSGRFALPLSENYQVTVVEPDIRPVEILRNRNSKVTVIHSSFQDWKFTEEKFDAVMFLDSIVYFQDMDWVFQTVSRLLRPGGLFLFNNINISSYKQIIKTLPGLQQHLYPGARRYGEMQSLIRRHAFEIKDEEGFNWMPIRGISDFPLIPFYISIEQGLQLGRIARKISPEILFSLIRR